MESFMPDEMLVPALLFALVLVPVLAAMCVAIGQRHRRFAGEARR